MTTGVPKTLTKAEFKKKRPKGSYKEYLNYLKKNRPPRDPLMDRAQALVDASIAPMRQQYEWAAKQRMADALAASKAAKGFTAAMGQMTGPGADISGNAYQAAAAALMGASTGAQGRAQEIASQAGAQAAADTARLSGVALPMPDTSATIAGPKAFAEIDAAQALGRAPLVRNTVASLDQAAKLSAANWADLQRFKGAREAADIRAKFLAEASKRPELLEKAYLALRGDAREQAALGLSRAELRLKAAAQALAEADSAAEHAEARQEYELAKAQLDAQIAGGYYDYEDARAPGQGGSGGGLSASKIQQMAESRGKVMASIVATTGENSGYKAIEGWLLDPTTGLPKKMSSTHQRAVSLLTRQYWAKLEPLTRGMKPAKREQVRKKMISQIKALLRIMTQKYPQLKAGYKPSQNKPTQTGPVDTSDDSGALPGAP